MSTLFNVVKPNSFVALRGHAEIAGVVKVDGQHVGLGSIVLYVVASEEFGRPKRRNDIAHRSRAGDVASAKGPRNVQGGRRV